MEHAEHRIWAGLVAFACGDAAGVPWETMPPADIDADAVPRLPTHRGWPTGSVSDDTIFLLSTAQVLASDNPSPRALLEQLAADLPRARGAGRTSRAGIERFIQTGQTSAKTGATNGAAMRALPIGWASPAKDVKRRVGQGIALARATHGDRSAIAAAIAVAAMGAWSVEGASIGEVVDQGSIEARVAVDHLGASRSVLAPIERAVHGAWQTPETGVPFLAIETVAAVVSVLRQAASTEDCIIRAVRLGGDTDTCAAIAAGIFAATTGDETISWRDRVPLLADPALLQLATRLARRRQAAMQSR